MPATGKHLPFSPATREQGKREQTRVTYRLAWSRRQKTAERETEKEKGGENIPFTQ